MSLDPARWSEQSQGAALLFVVALWLALPVAVYLGFEDSPLVRAWVAVGLSIFGGLYWRTLLLPWADIASWTIPLVVWMAGLVVLNPEAPPLAAVLPLLAGTVFFSLFVSGSPFILWWYRSVLRKPLPPVFGADDFDDLEQ